MCTFSTSEGNHLMPWVKKCHSSLLVDIKSSHMFLLIAVYYMFFLGIVSPSGTAGYSSSGLAGVDSVSVANSFG